MNRLLIPMLLAAAAPLVRAEVPAKAPVTRYSVLWNDFMVRTPERAESKPVDPLADYALAGVSPVAGGYFVTLLNRKKPDERLLLEPGRKSDFRVMEVLPGEAGPLSTRVRIGYGHGDSLLAFDPALLALKPSPKAAAPHPQPDVKRPRAAMPTPAPVIR